MSLYVRVNETPPSPGPVRAGRANAIVVGYDDDNDAKFLSLSGPVSGSGLDSKRVMRISSYAEFESAYNGTISNTPLAKWIKDYYNEEAGLGADAAFIYVYRFKTTDSGGTYTDEPAIRAGSLSEWRSEIGPVSTITNVKVSYDGGAPVTQDAGGYDEEEDDTGLKTGKITFKATYPRNAAGNYQQVNDEIDIVTMTYTTSGIADAFKVLRQVDAQFASLAYDHGRMTGSAPAEGIYGGASLVDDYKELVAFCNQSSGSGFYRQAICSLPANAKPGDSGTSYGATNKWQDLRQSDFGQTRNVMVPSFRQTPTTGDGYRGDFDGAAVLAAMIRKNGVRDDVLGTIPTTAIEAYESEALQLAFKQARILTIVKASHLVENSWLNYGYTFGIGVQKWINNVRCRYQIKHLLEANLLALILSGVIRYDVNGGYKLQAAITAYMEQAQLNGWHDGLVSIEIPIMPYMTKRNKSASDEIVIQTAAESGIWENIAVVYRWGTNTERIELSNLGEVNF